MFTVAAFYAFCPVEDLARTQAALLACGRTHQLKGTILLAPEGINSTLSGTKVGVEAMLALVTQQLSLDTLTVKWADHSEQPFLRFKVKLKREIVTMGIEGLDARQTGERVDPSRWNALIGEPDVVCIDTRNTYECGIGQFKDSINPNTATFRDFPAFVKDHLDPNVHRKIAMYCTGGIRCEKASAYLLSQGFESVYQLDGGILNYFDTVDPEHSCWQGSVLFLMDVSRWTTN